METVLAAISSVKTASHSTTTTLASRNNLERPKWHTFPHGFPPSMHAPSPFPFTLFVVLLFSLYFFISTLLSADFSIQFLTRMHACMHTYIHSYIPTYLPTFLMLLPSFMLHLFIHALRQSYVDPSRHACTNSCTEM